VIAHGFTYSRGGKIQLWDLILVNLNMALGGDFPCMIAPPCRAFVWVKKKEPIYL
jgi:hypothetical protein